MADEMRIKLANTLGLTPSNPWIWKLSDREILAYLTFAQLGLFVFIPLPIWTEPNGLQVFGDPDYHERRKRAN